MCTLTERFPRREHQLPPTPWNSRIIAPDSAPDKKQFSRFYRYFWIMPPNVRSTRWQGQTHRLSRGRQRRGLIQASRQITRDRFRALAHRLDESGKPLWAKPFNRPSDADGPDDLASRAEYRCRHTELAHFDLLVVKRYPCPTTDAGFTTKYPSGDLVTSGTMLAESTSTHAGKSTSRPSDRRFCASPLLWISRSKSSPRLR